MGAIDLDDPHIKDMTVNDFISTVIDLDPILKVVEVLQKSQQQFEALKNSYDRLDHLFKMVVKERDEAIEALKAYRREHP